MKADKITNPKTPLAQIIADRFPGLGFCGGHLKQAGKILKNQGKDATIKFLTGKSSPKDTIPDFQPPAKVVIVAQSRPFVEWNISKASSTIQEYIYGLSYNELASFIPGPSKKDHDDWINKTGLNLNDYQSVQGLNLIFGHTKSIYEGVLEKVKNRNEKNKRKPQTKHNNNETPFEEEQALDNEGKLLQPPGVNRSIYCYQQISPKPCKNLDGFKDIPAEYVDYCRNPDDKIFSATIDRLDISQGECGYIPVWQRPLLSKKIHRRQRKWYSNQSTSKYSVEEKKEAQAKDALLCQIKIGEDWVIFDARGLLRNLYWRKLVPSGGVSLNEILDKFTGDPVIDPEHNNITFVYKEGIVDVHSQKITSTKRAPDIIKKLTTNNPICLVSIDLGQTNPVSTRYSRIDQKNGELVPTLIDKQFLPQNLLNEISKYREKTDQVRDEINAAAIQTLVQDYQDEFASIRNDTPENAANRVQEKYGIKIYDLSYNEMSSYTTHIADAYLDSCNDSPNLVMFTPYSKKGSKEESASRKKSDKMIANEIKLRVSKEAREEKQKVVWNTQKESKEYIKLSTRKKEFGRRIANHIVREAKKLAGLQIVLNVEHLGDLKKFHGSGKREAGWENFFVYKKENRWFMQVLHKSLTDLGLHRGTYIIESFPARTSITCTSCGHCDKKNRDGEKFKCLKCKFEANADLDIATLNLERVALSGRGMPRERSSDTKKPTSARKTENTNIYAEILEGKEIDTLKKAMWDASKDNRSQNVS